MTSFAGRWLTSFGPMDLTQTGAAVAGSYQGHAGACKIEGTVEGGRLTFRYAEPQEQGSGWFDMTAFGRFAGRYQPDGSAREFDWLGSREWEGVWETSFGRMRLVQEPERVFGYYEGGVSATLEGKVEGERLVFKYQEPNVAGEGWFALDDGAQSFAGEWRPEGGAGWSAWQGRRVAPKPHLTWLVVVEAHWQRTVDEPEYSYGGMVREFFARVPGVAVRQRFFNDAASLERWCRELLYLPEPAIVMFASHGTPAGLSVHGRTVDTRLVIEALQHAPNIRLAHFSSCLVLWEDEPGAFARRIAREVPFPISGYTTSVDWGGSAIIEFNYLDMILSKGMPPARAAELLPALVGYAGDDAPPGSPYAPAGFRFFQPGEPVPPAEAPPEMLRDYELCADESPDVPTA